MKPDEWPTYQDWLVGKATLSPMHRILGWLKHHGRVRNGLTLAEAESLRKDLAYYINCEEP